MKLDFCRAQKSHRIIVECLKLSLNECVASVPCPDFKPALQRYLQLHFTIILNSNRIQSSGGVQPAPFRGDRGSAVNTSRWGVIVMDTSLGGYVSLIFGLLKALEDLAGQKNPSLQKILWRQPKHRHSQVWRAEIREVNHTQILLLESNCGLPYTAVLLH